MRRTFTVKSIKCARKFTDPSIITYTLFFRFAFLPSPVALPITYANLRGKSIFESQLNSNRFGNGASDFFVKKRQPTYRLRIKLKCLVRMRRECACSGVVVVYSSVYHWWRHTFSLSIAMPATLEPTRDARSSILYVRCTRIEFLPTNALEKKLLRTFLWVRTAVCAVRRLYCGSFAVYVFCVSCTERSSNFHYSDFRQVVFMWFGTFIFGFRCLRRVHERHGMRRLPSIHSGKDHTCHVRLGDCAYAYVNSKSMNCLHSTNSYCAEKVKADDTYSLQHTAVQHASVMRPATKHPASLYLWRCLH